MSLTYLHARAMKKTVLVAGIPDSVLDRLAEEIFDAADFVGAMRRLCRLRSQPESAREARASTPRRRRRPEASRCARFPSHSCADLETRPRARRASGCARPRAPWIAADLERAVRALGVDDEDLVGPGERSQAAGDVLFLVPREDDGGDRNHGALPACGRPGPALPPESCAPGGATSTRRHCASTASTPMSRMQRCSSISTGSSPHHAGIPG